MFKIITKGSEALKTALGLASSLNEECILRVNEDGLGINIMDINHTGMVFFSLSKEEMRSFEFDEEQKIGVRTDDLSKILKRIGKSDITIQRKLSHCIEISGNNKHYEITLVQTETIEKDSPAAPKIPTNTPVIIPYADFKECVEDVLFITEMGNLTVEEGVISFKGEDEGKKCTTTYMNESIKTEETIKGTFDLKYIDNALKTVPSSSKITLNIGNNSPLCVTFEGENMGVLKYYLAPRVPI